MLQTKQIRRGQTLFARIHIRRSSFSSSSLCLEPIYVNNQLHYAFYVIESSQNKIQLKDKNNNPLLSPQKGLMRFSRNNAANWPSSFSLQNLDLDFRSASITIKGKQTPASSPLHIVQVFSFIGNGNQIIRPENNGQFYGISTARVFSTKTCNEDKIATFRDSQGNQYFVVADGMGGYNNASLAAKETISLIEQAILSGAAPEKAIRYANNMLCKLLPNDGATIALVKITPRQEVFSFHAGDCQVWVMDKKHNFLIKTEPENARENGVQQKGQVTNCVGITDNIRVNINRAQPGPGGWILVFSDGLANNIYESKIEGTIFNADSAQNAAEELHSLAYLNMSDVNGIPNIGPSREIDDLSILAIQTQN